MALPIKCFGTLLAAAVLSAGTAQAGDPYVAELQPLNADKLGRSAEGTATLEVRDGRLTISVQASGTAPGTMHLQHYHGFTTGKDAGCPGTDADTNGDGYVDLLETEPMAGTTLVPFHGSPASLKIATHSYPTADSDGRIRYEQTVAMDELESALEREHDVSDVDFDKRVVFLHGTAKSASLPDSVRSLPGVPAQVTLPIACGEIRQTR
ncbi:hypothetical protein [Thiohalorhabdus methylotrophus]|uniref:CHRD domain-containing protein n=1 Tax=Thiohalorhabdus methylotrophus TaxID=3242694 RepID=A0ABV4TS74_9GAMM